MRTTALVVAVIALGLAAGRLLGSSSGDSTADREFLVAADAQAAVTMSGGRFAAVDRSGRTLWTVTPPEGSYEYNVLCVRTCRDVALVPFSNYPDQVDAPVTWVVGGHPLTEGPLPATVAKHQVLWALDRATYVAWETDRSGQGRLVGVADNRPTVLVPKVDAAPYATPLPGSASSVAIWWHDDVPMSATLALDASGWRVVWTASVPEGNGCAAGEATTAVIHAGVVVSLDPATGSVADRQPGPADDSVACFPGPQGVLTAAWTQAENGVTTTHLAGLGYACSAELEGQNFVTVSPDGIVGYAADDLAATWLTGDCKVRRVVNGARGAQAVAGGAAVLRGDGTVEWLRS